MKIPSTPSVHLTLHVAARCLSEAERNELYEAALATIRVPVYSKHKIS